MSTQNIVESPVLSTEELNDLILEAIQDIKGKNITKINLRKVDDAPTDFFIVCEGDSTTQVNAIASNISRKLRKEAGIKPSHMEGTRESRWILVDYFHTIVHVFHPESREYYDIEDLWSDGEFTEYQDL